MALVTISGYPCSGKTTRARELAAFFEAKTAQVSAASGSGSGSGTLPKFDVVVVDDEGCHVTRAAYDGKSRRMWATGSSEPTARTPRGLTSAREGSSFSEGDSLVESTDNARFVSKSTKTKAEKPRGNYLRVPCQLSTAFPHDLPLPSSAADH